MKISSGDTTVISSFLAQFVAQGVFKCAMLLLIASRWATIPETIRSSFFEALSEETRAYVHIKVWPVLLKSHFVRSK